MWINDVPLVDRDMCAVVVGVGFAGEPIISRSPSAFAHDFAAGSSLPADTFTITNVGTGALNYTITDNVTWMSVSPPNGSSTGQTDTCTITYSNIHLLPPGTFVGTITIAAIGAVNSPQTVTVTLHVQESGTRADIDQDGDVDQSDFARLQVCLSGEGIEQLLPACQAARLDADPDVDLTDANILIGCYSGANVPLNPACAN
jgi:hypothetical protein